MPFPTWRIPAKIWLSSVLYSFTMLSLVGCYAPHRGPYGAPYNSYPPPNSYPSGGGGTIQPGPTLGPPTDFGKTPTPIGDGGGGVPNYESPDNNNSFPKEPYNGFERGSGSRGGGFDGGSTSKDGFGGRQDAFQENSYKRKDAVPNYRDPEEFKKPIQGPSATDDLESPFSEARKKKETILDAVPKSRPSVPKTLPADPLEEFNEDPFKKDAPKKEQMFDEQDMFDSGAKFQVPTRLKQVSRSQEIGNKEEAVIDRYIKAAASSSQPNPYDYDKKNHQWLRGVVDYDQKSGAWNIIYDIEPDKKDPFGGSITLIESPILAKLHDHDIILVEGEVDRKAKADRLGKPRFRVQRLLGPLVPKQAKPKRLAPVAN